MEKMVRSVIVFIVVVLALNACQKIEPKPDNLLEPEAFTEVLIDYYIYKQSNEIAAYSNYEVGNYTELNLAIAKKHNLTYRELENNWNYYILQDRKSYEKILLKVEEGLNDRVPDLDINPALDEISRNKIVSPTAKKPKPNKVPFTPKGGKEVRVDDFIKSKQIKKIPANPDLQKKRVLPQNPGERKALPNKANLTRPKAVKSKLPTKKKGNTYGVMPVATDSKE